MHKNCPQCFGKGIITKSPPYPIYGGYGAQPCLVCGGSGQVIDHQNIDRVQLAALGTMISRTPKSTIILND